MQSGFFRIAFHGAVKDLQAIPELVWSYRKSMTSDWASSQVECLAEGVKRKIQEFQDCAPESVQTATVFESFEVAEAGLECLDAVAQGRPQVEIVVAADIDFSISGTKMRFYYFSPAGSGTICEREDKTSWAECFSGDGILGENLICSPEDFNGISYRFSMEQLADLCQEEKNEDFYPGRVVVHCPDGSWEVLRELDREGAKEDLALKEEWGGRLFPILDSELMLLADDVTMDEFAQACITVLKRLAPDREFVCRYPEDEESEEVFFFDTEGREYFIGGMEQWNYEPLYRAYPIPMEAISWAPFGGLLEEEDDW